VEPGQNRPTRAPVTYSGTFRFSYHTSQLAAPEPHGLRAPSRQLIFAAMTAVSESRAPKTKRPAADDGPTYRGVRLQPTHVWTAALRQGHWHKKQRRIESSHVSGLLARRDGRWPRWVSRSGRKHLCGFERALAWAGFSGSAVRPRVISLCSCLRHHARSGDMRMVFLARDRVPLGCGVGLWWRAHADTQPVTAIGRR
jgi:hypothetical protein